MDVTALMASLQESVPGARCEPGANNDLQPTVFVSRDELPAVARLMRERPDLRFDLLAELTAIDFWPRDPRFEVVYVLVSIAHRRRIRLKVRLSGGDAHVGTVSAIWPAANWLEREVADLFGVVFDGHPDPRRLLMPEDWEGYPLRKDYPVQITMAPKTTEALQMTEAEFRANLEHDRTARR
ncbi:MAG: NADH-quinone oxidoreductase subunit C [Acidobacteriota bacterium]